VSPLELVGDSDRIVKQLRASRPVASAALRERVAALGPEPAPRWSFSWPSRRLVLGFAGAALLASFVAAGLTRAPNKPRAEGFQPSVSQHGSRVSTPQRLRAAKEAEPVFGAARVPAPSAARLQRYQATLRLRVKNVESLSNATRRAMTLARSLGGYVSEVQYSTHAGKRGGARVVLRVPVGSIQAALTTLTGLGTILQQQTGILDVTRRADRESQQITKLKKQLSNASQQAAQAIRAHLRTLQAKHLRLLRSASLARIVMTLTTPVQQAAAPGRLHRTLDDAGGVFLRELQFLLYALIVAGPLLLLAGAGLVTARAARKRSDSRLLERA
jgi:Domain of unknown function (DUF4349)